MFDTAQLSRLKHAPFFSNTDAVHCFIWFDSYAQHGKHAACVLTYNNATQNKGCILPNPNKTKVSSSKFIQQKYFLYQIHTTQNLCSTKYKYHKNNFLANLQSKKISFSKSKRQKLSSNKSKRTNKECLQSNQHNKKIVFYQIHTDKQRMPSPNTNNTKLFST